MVAYYLNCLICGCGWGSQVIQNVELMKKYLKLEYYKYLEFPNLAIDEAIHDKKISEEIGKKLLKSLKFLPVHKWMKDIITIQPGKIVDVMLEVEDWYEIYDKNGNEYEFYEHDINKNNYEKKAYIMHKSCYQLLENNGYDVSYEAFKKVDNIKPVGRIKVGNQNIKNNRFNINYGIADKYIGEYGIFYEYVAYIHDPYLLLDPLKNENNAKRILKLKIPLFKLKKESISKKTSKKTSKKNSRKGPIESATLFKLGTKKIGNDKNMWIIIETKNGVKRWKQLNKNNKGGSRKKSKYGSRKRNNSRKGSKYGSRRRSKYDSKKRSKNVSKKRSMNYSRR